MFFKMKLKAVQNALGHLHWVSLSIMRLLSLTSGMSVRIFSDLYDKNRKRSFCSLSLSNDYYI